jgi:hypothetical protein
VNSATEAVKVVTTPKRRISQPVSGTVTPLATAKAVITQVAVLLSPRLPAMVLSATLAMVESSTCMKVPSASASATVSSPPSSGGGRGHPGAAGALTARRRRWRR